MRDEENIENAQQAYGITDIERAHNMKDGRSIEDARKLLDAIGEIDDRYIDEAEKFIGEAAEQEGPDREEPDLEMDDCEDRNPEEEEVLEEADEEGIYDDLDDAEQELYEAEEEKAALRAERKRRQDYRRNFNRWGMLAAVAAVILLGASIYKGVIRHVVSTASVSELASEKNGENDMTTDMDTASAESAAADSMTGGNTTMANPWSDFDTLEEAEEWAGIKITIPESVGHYDQLLYRAMKGEMIEIIYTGADGDEGLRIRKSAAANPEGENGETEGSGDTSDSGTADISGDYNNYTEQQTLENVAVPGDSGETVNVAAAGTDGYIYKAIWTRTQQGNAGSAYSVTVTNAKLTGEDMRALVSAID